MPTMIDPATIPSTSARTNPGACPLCGAELHNAAECDRCDWVQGYGKTGIDLHRNPRDTFAAAVSLLWPGAGHFYKGHTHLAIILAAGAALSFVWSIVFLMFGGPLILPVYWVGVATHAFFLKDLKHPDISPMHLGMHPAR